jgi:nucleoside-diphosphate kinase
MTENILKNRTLTLIKPECVASKHIGNIIQRIEQAGFTILGIRMLKLTRKEAEEFYLVHKNKPFYTGLVEYMSGGKIVAMVLEKENCVQDFRQFIGATNPTEAAEGTIRRDFGTNIQNNCVHASDSNENAQKEISFFFSNRDILMNIE